MCLYIPLLWAKCQGNWMLCSCFMVIFAKVHKKTKKKKREKMKKLSQFLKSHVSGMLDVILLKIGMWSTDIGKHVHSKNFLAAWSYECLKIPFTFFLSMYFGIEKMVKTCQFRDYPTLLQGFSFIANIILFHHFYCWNPLK